MKVDQILNKDDKQFLSGVIYTIVAGGVVLKNARSEKDYDKEEDKYRLYALSEEWDCQLRKGMELVR